MIKKTICYFGIILPLLSQTVFAETKYVTDDLNLALHEKEGSKGALIKRLASGTQLEVLEESGFFAKVRTQDGTVGWTKARFLMTEKPAQARVLDLEKEQEQLKKELISSQEQLKSSNKQAAELRAKKIQTALELVDHKEMKEADAGLIAKLQKENASLKQRLDPNVETMPMIWALIGVSVALLLGFLAGIALFDWLSRKRHGGYRIY
ncbi:MAG: TIGR04211 family SH3 domain-containing protein [Pseudomonadota bacterium]